MSENIQIDPGAGPCFGVQRAIKLAEDLLSEQDTLMCLGDLIHNNEELNRLEDKGLRIVTHCQLVEQKGKKLLIRAHGEPPSTFRIAEKYDVDLIDASCPIVKQLQIQLEEASVQMVKQKGQIILFGDENHAEVLGLKGYCRSEFYVVSNLNDIEELNIAKPSIFFSQTTKYQSDYHKIVDAFKQKQKAQNRKGYYLKVIDSVCKYVAKRDLQLFDFLRDKDVLVFVSDRKSSNGKYLFSVGKAMVKKAYFISNPEEIQKPWFKSGQKIGISGATSTPLWLLEDTLKKISELEI